MASNPIGNELVTMQGLDGAGKPSAITEVFSLTQATNFEGSAYLANSVSVTSTTLLTASGFSVTLQAAGVYVFEIYLTVTNGASGGLKLTPSGTATATTFSADTWAYNTATVVAQSNIVALSGNYMAFTGAVTTVDICGTIVVNAGGTFGLSFSQNVSNATATTLNAGCNYWIDKIV